MFSIFETSVNSLKKYGYKSEQSLSKTLYVKKEENQKKVKSLMEDIDKFGDNLDDTFLNIYESQSENKKSIIMNNCDEWVKK